MLSNFLNRRNNNVNEEMTFIDHLEALRWHVIRSVIAVAIIAFFIFFNIRWVFESIIAGPIQPDFYSYRAFCNLSHFLHIGDTLCMPPVHIQMQTTTFGGQFIGSISIALIGGFIVAFPYIFWEFWNFIKPALHPKERKNIRFIIFFVSFFFFLGAAFGYFILGPFTFNFLANFQIGKVLETRPTLNDYIDNLTNIILGCGIAFELPVVSYTLTRIGLITPGLLIRSQKIAILIILIVAAFITPSPDWISQMIVALPLYALYILSIFVSKRAFKEYETAGKEWS